MKLAATQLALPFEDADAQAREQWHNERRHRAVLRRLDPPGDEPRRPDPDAGYWLTQTAEDRVAVGMLWEA